MSSEQRIDEDLRFIDTCLELHLLSETDAQTLQEAVRDKRGYVAQEAVQRGLLTPADVDIVHSLQHPTEVVPGYEILGLVGRGGMGVVYRAKQLDLERIVALKTVLISNVSSPTAAARFEREAKALARLQHPNIVQALNFGKHQGRYYFAMEYVTGRSCEQALRQEGRLVPRAVWSFVRQVASGLLHALRHNVIHRDIKPANLLLLPPPEGSLECGGNEVVKITDFGLAMFADSSPDQLKLTTGDKIMGSPAYMSPEQFGGDTVDFRADIYSLGATAWHLLFGAPPFQGNNIAVLLSQKSQPLQVDRSQLPVQIPDDQWQLLMRMLDPEEDARPASYEVLIEEIDRLGLPTAPVGPPGIVVPTTPAISEQPTIESQLQSSTSTPVEGGKAAAPQLTPTLEIPTPSSDAAPRERSATRSRWLVVLAVGIIVVLAAGTWAFFGPAERGPRVYTRVVESTPLFDGVTLSGWDVGGSMIGAWNTVESPDASTAIVCNSIQGALTRRVDEKTHPRISLFVWPQPGADAIDIDFAVDPSDSKDIRGSLRFIGDEVGLGRKQEDFDELSAATFMAAPATMGDRFHVVHIERQPSDWYVFLEERLVGTIPINNIGSGNAIRIVVHSPIDPAAKPPLAYFADVRLDDLQ